MPTMTNRPKNIGTAGETAVVKYLKVNGFPYAERRALRGRLDVGDITGTPGLIWEVKAGDAARLASDNQIEAWLAETLQETVNADADYGILVVARPRKNVRDWWACMWAGDLSDLITDPQKRDPYVLVVPVRTPLHYMVSLLRVSGYGDPLPDAGEGKAG